MEATTSIDTRTQVLDVIRQKAWYSYRPDGSFDWMDSVGQIATALQLSPDTVRDAIESAFDGASLTTLSLETDGNTTQISLIEALSKLNQELYLWTVGDTAWQQKKMDNTGASHFVDPNHILNFTRDKIEGLRKVLDVIVESRPVSNTKIHIIVVDDKRDNVDSVTSMTEEYSNKGIEIHTYHMKLNEPLANAERCYTYIVDLVNRHSDDRTIILLDFDGVVANTDGVLFGKACDNIAQLLA